MPRRQGNAWCCRGPFPIAAAFVSGYAALRVLLKLLDKGKLSGFAYYCWLVGLVTIITGWL